MPLSPSGRTAIPTAKPGVGTPAPNEKAQLQPAAAFVPLETPLAAKAKASKRGKLQVVNQGQSRYKLFVGIDVSSSGFVAAFLQPAPTQSHFAPSNPASFNYKKQSAVSELDRFCKWLQKDAPGVAPPESLIVLEVTGNYWLPVAAYLQERGYAVAVINPRQSHSFAKASALALKNDAVDAQVLSVLAYQQQPAVWTAPSASYHEISQRLAHRDSLIEMRTLLSNQLHALDYNPYTLPGIRASKLKLYEQLDAEIDAIEKELAEQVKELDEDWSKSLAAMLTIPGVGLLTALWIICLTLNLSECESAEALVAYAGLAPRQKQSGNREQHATIGGGNFKLRSKLYRAAMSATQPKPAIKEYALRLKANGRKGQRQRDNLCGSPQAIAPDIRDRHEPKGVRPRTT